MGRFRGAYYWGNALTFAAYPVLRWWAVHSRGLRGGRLLDEGELRAWERQAFGTLTAALMVKFSRRTSLDGFFSEAFLFTRACLLLLGWMMDVRVFSWFVALFVLALTFLQQPVYQGLDNITFLTPASFERLVVRGRGVWMVVFFAPWAPPCVHLEPVVARLSLKYGGPASGVRFAKLDLARWPGVGKEHGIVVSPSSGQLPTIVLFEDGEEVARIPHVFPDGTVVRGRFRERDIVRGFDLEKRSKGGAMEDSASLPDGVGEDAKKTR